jgi:uncharacterized protein YebE (UPF0316 family)
MIDALFWCLLIFFARLVDVSMGTMRTILIIRGRRGIASISAFFEIIVWILAISRVITELDKWYYMIAFALGFASGNYMGSYLEEKIALGYSFAYLVPKKNSGALERELRAQGFGITVIQGRGMKGPELVFNLMLKRRDTKRFIKIITKHDKNIFYTIMDVHAIHGGHMRFARKGKN